MLERAFVLVPVREVLALPSFKRAAWDDLRERVGSSTADVVGVERWLP